MSSLSSSQVRDAVVNAVKNPNVPPRSVLVDITNEVVKNPNTENYLGLLPSAKTLAKNIQRKRRLNLNAPPIPRTWEDMVVPEVFKVVLNHDFNENVTTSILQVTMNSSQFLIMEEQVPGTGKKS
jgi:hypothetical protein